MKKILSVSIAVAVAGALYAQMAVVEGANEVGFSALTGSGGENCIITVPFVACQGGDGDIKLADLVSTNGLVGVSEPAQAASADQLIVMVDADGLKYYYYYLDSEDGWTGITTSVKHPDGSESSVTPTAAADLSIARGKGFWLKRASGSDGSIYVKGEVSASNPSTTIVNGLNLVGYGTADAFELNRETAPFNYSGVDGGNGNTVNSDRITVVGGDGTLSSYYYFTKPAGAQWDGYADLDGKWITEKYEVANVTVPAGQGFWYLRRDGGQFSFQPDGSN